MRRVVRARRAGLGWPLPDELREEDLYWKLFLEVKKPQMEERPLPDGEAVHRDLARKGVTLKLLWQEYRERNPDGYGRSQFCEHYLRWKRTQATSMRMPHKGGEEMEVDYAGMTVPVTNPETGEIW